MKDTEFRVLLRILKLLLAVVTQWLEQRSSERT